jgi:hypothetical protein
VKHFVGLGDLLESLLGRLVPGVAVRVILEGELAVGLLDLLVARAAGYAERLVIVALAQGGPSPAESAETTTCA